MALLDQPTSPRLASRTRQTLILCAFLAACTLLLYHAVDRNGFVNYDDDTYIVSNPHVQSGLHWSTVRWAFTTFDAANWHPLTWLSHLLDYQLFQFSPAGHHRTNVLLHAANAVLLFLLLAEATGSIWIPLLAALAFALHPLNVESVAWAAERKNVLSMFFFLLALWAYQRYARQPSAPRYAAVALAFACGLMAKPQVITLPFLLLLWDYWPLNRFEFRAAAAHPSHAEVPLRSPAWLLMEKLPLLALSAASALLTLKAQQAGGALRSATVYPVFVRICSAICAYPQYVAKFLWPARLAPMYPYRGESIPGWQVAAAALIVLAFTALVIALEKGNRPRRRYLAVGWFWFLGSLIPMIGLVQVGDQAMADRYMYLPMIGLLIMIGWGLADLAGGARTSQIGLACATAAALVALGALTHRQISFWQSSETLWSHAVAVTDNHYVASLNLGETLINHGRTEEAAVQFRAAAQIRPNDPAAILDLATCERRQGKFTQALADDQAVLRLASDNMLRAYALVNLGTDYRKLNDDGRARESYSAALRLKPETSLAFIAFLNLGVVAEHTGDFGEAARNYERATELEPSDVAYILLSHALRHTGQTAAAEVAWDEARQHSANFDRAQQAAQKLLAQ